MRRYLKKLFRKGVLIFISVLLFSGFLVLAVLNDSAQLGSNISSNGEKSISYAKDRVLVKFKIYVFNISDEKSVESIVQMLQKDPGIEYAEFDFVYKADVIPNYPRFSELWGLHNTGQSGGTPDADIDAPEAWDYSTGSNSVIVAVIDTGVDYNHQDLSANMWRNPGEIPGNGNDDDGNGYIDDVYGIDTYNNDSDPIDDNGHGTHVAGTIGAIGNNAIGVAGVCWNVKIMALKFLGSGGSGSTSDAIECIQYAINKGAHVMSNSWGGGAYSNALRDAILAAQNAGILFVAAAGNDSSDNDLDPHYPSSYDCDNIIAVAATDRYDNLASFSNYGPVSVDVAAPGVSILSTVPGNSYAFYSGTSMATPHVSGLCALLKSYNQSWNWIDIKRRVFAGVDRLNSLIGKILTEGRINAYNSLFVNTQYPHIYRIDPSRGVIGQQVSIYGYSFGSSQGSGYVEFAGGAIATISSWSDFRIICTVPSGAQSGLVYVQNSNGLRSNGYNFAILQPYYTESLISNEFAGGGTPKNWRADDSWWSYNLPFSFPFYGTNYSTIYVSSNGYIDFISGSSDFTNSTEELIGNVRVAPMWIDLITNGSAQSGEDIYITETTNYVIIRWCAQTYFYASPVNFEVVLYRDGRIKFNYGSGNSNIQSPSASAPTIGISC